MGDTKDGGTGRFVTSSGLDTDESVLDDIDSTDSVLSGESVELEEDFDGIGVDSSGSGDGDLGGQSLDKLYDNLLGLFRSSLGRAGQLPHVRRRSSVGVLQNSSLVRDMEQVLIGRPRLGRGLEDGDAMLSGVVEESGSTGESVVELGESPRSNNLDRGLETVEGELESDLVVSLSSASVGDVAASERRKQNQTRRQLTIHFSSIDLDLVRRILTRTPPSRQPRSFLGR